MCKFLLCHLLTLCAVMKICQVGDKQWALWGVLLGLGSPDANAVTYKMLRSSMLTSWPSFEMRCRVEFDPLEVTVKGAALE